MSIACTNPSVLESERLAEQFRQLLRDIQHPATAVIFRCRSGDRQISPGGFYLAEAISAAILRVEVLQGGLREARPRVMLAENLWNSGRGFTRRKLRVRLDQGFGFPGQPGRRDQLRLADPPKGGNWLLAGVNAALAALPGGPQGEFLRPWCGFAASPRDLAWALLPWTRAMEAAVLSLLQHKDAAGLPRGVYRPERLDRLTEAEKAELARQVLETQAFWPGAEDPGRRIEIGTVLPACLVPPHCPAEYEWIQFPSDPGVQNPLGFYILTAAQQPVHFSRHGIRYGG